LANERDLSGTVRLVYFNAGWQSFVTLSCPELFAYISNLGAVDPIDETIQMRIYQWLVNDSSTLPFAERETKGRIPELSDAGLCDEFEGTAFCDGVIGLRRGVSRHLPDELGEGFSQLNQG
jgi:hypothetical protein